MERHCLRVTATGGQGIFLQCSKFDKYLRCNRFGGSWRKLRRNGEEGGLDGTPTESIVLFNIKHSP